MASRISRASIAFIIRTATGACQTPPLTNIHPRINVCGRIYMISKTNLHHIRRQSDYLHERFAKLKHEELYYEWILDPHSHTIVYAGLMATTNNHIIHRYQLGHVPTIAKQNISTDRRTTIANCHEYMKFADGSHITLNHLPHIIKTLYAAPGIVYMFNPTINTADCNGFHEYNLSAKCIDVITKLEHLVLHKEQYGVDEYSIWQVTAKTIKFNDYITKQAYDNLMAAPPHQFIKVRNTTYRKMKIDQPHPMLLEEANTAQLQL